MNDVVPQSDGREIAVAQQQAVEETGSMALMQIIQQLATSKDFDVQKLDQLLAVKERWEANEARKLYVAAMAQFKAEQIEIRKTKHVHFKTDRGTTDYYHADLADAVDAAVPKMSKYGLSHRWDTQQEGTLITVSCVITHEAGHSERTTLSASPDASGGKNSIQAIGSAVQYLQRYTFMAATGLAAKGMDDDGRGAGQPTGDQPEQSSAPHQNSKARPPYADADITKNLSQWQAMVEAERTTPERIIAKIETRNTLTDAQKKRIKNIKGDK